MGHRMGFQPFVLVQNCKHMVLALVGLWQCDIVNLPSLPIFIFQPSSSIPLGLYLLGLLDCSTCFTFMDNLCDGVHTQVTPW